MVSAGTRVEAADVLTGITRLAIKARTAPMQWQFQVWFTQQQMEIFEGFYREALEHHDGEFYAHWIGGSRIVAFASNYAYAPIGKGWILSATAIRTRIDPTICDEYLSGIFTAIYRADLAAVDHYEADLTASDVYQDDWALALIAGNEC